MIVALAGGVGGARLAVGLAAVLSPSQLSVVVNTGDDFEHLGLHVSPDLDTVMYTLAGVNNPLTGWGRADESWQFMSALKALGGAAWFNLGDQDLAVHVLRTQALREGQSLTQVTAELAQRFGIRHALLPMSDAPVRTRVRTGKGELAFQDYFVRERCRPRVSGFRFAGARSAMPSPALQTLMRGGKLRGLVICPSNPFVSVAPILAVPAIRAWLKARDFPVVAVSPIIGGAALKGPAAKMMRELKLETSAAGVARHYGKLVDGWVIDRADAELQSEIETKGCGVMVTDTIMRNRARSARLARDVVGFTRALARGYKR
ncbi:MAG: 2-phospho-L-lactate transferase [Betaproteobacteria bacterium]|nr:2-phospho-L-lactate transferase [Betaproteobacteria bacterium]